MFLTLNDDSALHCPAWKTSTLSRRFYSFFVQASVPSRLASALPPPSRPPPHRGINVSSSMTYAHRIPPACRVMPTCFFFFSSPEPKAHLWAYSIGRHPSSVVCRTSSVCQHFQISSPQKPLGQLKPNFMWRLYGSGKRKFLQTVMVTWPRCRHPHIWQIP